MLREQHPTHLAWLDLEMTGLDPNRDVILQAALVVTDANLQTLEEYACDIWQPPESLAAMTPYVREMHQSSGLLRRVTESQVDLRAAERQLIERVTGWCVYPAKLCGSSVGYDKRFLERWMPGLDGYLSYRVLDVTAVKLVAQLWYGDDAVFNKKAAGAHDARVDIRNSIAELAHYRATLFRQLAQTP